MTRIDRIARIARIALALAVFAPAMQAQTLQDKIEFAKSKVYPALVNISVVAQTFDSGRTQRVAGAGSGTIISPAGHVTTNFHVVQDAQRVTCTLPTGESIPADVLASDPAIDLAVLKLRLNEREHKSTALPFATLGDSSTLNVGDYVLAVGNPMGLSSSMTLGIASNTARVFTDFLGNEAENLDIGAHATGMYTRWIQHDALILPGNSGGPLVDMRGEIVGMNTRGGQGMAFATPSNLLKKSINRILSYGEVRRGWLGLNVKPVRGIGRTTGVLITAVAPGSPAGEVGLEPGDIVLALDEDSATCRFMDELPLFYEKIADRAPNSEVKITYERQGANRNVTATLSARELEPRVVEVREIGATVSTLGRARAARFGSPDLEGILVNGVRGGQPFDRAKPPIRRGDVIVEIQSRVVKDSKSFKNVIVDHLGSEDIAVRLRRGRKDVIAVVSLNEQESSKPKPSVIASAWLGVSTQVLTPAVARAAEHPDQRGYRLTSVYAGTRASEAGLQAGDLLIAIDETALNAYRPQDSEDLSRLLENEYSIADTIVAKVIRGTETLEFPVKLQPAPKTAGEAEFTRHDAFEFTVREMILRDTMSRQNSQKTRGVIVTECTSGGWASLGGLHVRDIVTAVNGHPITDKSSFDEVFAAIDKERPQNVTVFVRRGPTTTIVVIQPSWQ